MHACENREEGIMANYLPNLQFNNAKYSTFCTLKFQSYMRRSELNYENPILVEVQEIHAKIG